MTTLTLIIPLLGAILVMTALWLASGKGRHAEWVDCGWAALIGLLAVYFSCITSGALNRRLILAILPAFWAIRLVTHLYVDRIRTGRGDSRYRQLHADWGDEYRWRFFIFFQMQAVLAFLLTLPLYLGGMSPEPLSGAFLLAGVALFLFSLGGEALADRQLRRFKEEPANSGAVCTAGLWRYSRHPNYFFEWLHWLSYVLLLWETNVWWASLLVAVVMLVLILFVTGIPPTEAQSIQSRGQAFREYQRTTSAFFPWFPKQKEVP